MQNKMVRRLVLKGSAALTLLSLTPSFGISTTNKAGSFGCSAPEKLNEEDLSNSKSLKDKEPKRAMVYWLYTKDGSSVAQADIHQEIYRKRLIGSTAVSHKIAV
ncbi:MULTISPECIES: hypothetical protein [unclassified Bartonella]|uniref:hypothetical protein n=1 Tax=unclassified Bartonella TaxID=2645622 RepID=UPI0021C70352|nr:MULTISPECIES: hypothetical protein [unclassified Bartonella]UXN03172.1 hypothetical protein N6B01_12010 [Bartonella sp. HY406]UXN06136.1 hypothetical protein N6A79_12755 [Bartonella sp. HY761]